LHDARYNAGGLEPDLVQSEEFPEHAQVSERLPGILPVPALIVLRRRLFADQAFSNFTLPGSASLKSFGKVRLMLLPALCLKGPGASEHFLLFFQEAGSKTKNQGIFEVLAPKPSHQPKATTPLEPQGRC
jgi:hypothetical protein